VEAGYDRTVSPGQPTTAAVLPAANPLQVAANLLAAIPTGFDDALQEAGQGRPFGTVPTGPYGVGGPAVALPATNPALTAENAHVSFAAKQADPAAVERDTTSQDTEAVRKAPFQQHRAAVTAAEPPDLTSTVPKTTPTDELHQTIQPRADSSFDHSPRSIGTDAPSASKDVRASAGFGGTAAGGAPRATTRKPHGAVSQKEPAEPRPSTEEE
jgi:hypothetical protein